MDGLTQPNCMTTHKVKSMDTNVVSNHCLKYTSIHHIWYNWIKWMELHNAIKGIGIPKLTKNLIVKYQL